MAGERPGPVVFLGSGETSRAGGQVFEAVVQRLSRPLRIAALETPAGFELNSPEVVGRVAEFLRVRLQNYHPEITVIAARKRNTPFSPDDPEITRPLLDANFIFLGPGSPTYAVRQLRESLAWYRLLARHRLGAAIVMASAATCAVGSYTLPVYEIYKVGEELHWQKGLDFFAAFGLRAVFVPHWNNAEGGPTLDTSRCWMGKERFLQLLELLPEPELTVVGIDEHTGLIMDLVRGSCEVMGLGGVYVLKLGPSGRVLQERSFAAGERFPLAEIGTLQEPEPGFGIPAAVWREALEVEAARETAEVTPAAPSDEVLALVQQRQEARARRDWSTADALREHIATLGWKVIDTLEGPVLEPIVKNET